MLHLLSFFLLLLLLLLLFHGLFHIIGSLLQKAANLALVLLSDKRKVAVLDALARVLKATNSRQTLLAADLVLEGAVNKQTPLAPEVQSPGSVLISDNKELVEPVNTDGVTYKFVVISFHCDKSTSKCLSEEGN